MYKISEHKRLAMGDYKGPRGTGPGIKGDSWSKKGKKRKASKVNEEDIDDVQKIKKAKGKKKRKMSKSIAAREGFGNQVGKRKGKGRS